ncbi:TM2 domain-containing protein [Oscillospiraceae bacterium LTW-04]|nr:TM2 domain-containing protein [Oscillospiraceae bacterium MB24-C1]
MYCRNCGNAMDDRAVVCVKCGVRAGDGPNYCQNCGRETTAPNAVVCTYCGAGLIQPIPAYGQKSRLAAGLFGIFLGGLGIHNFYLGYTGRAIAQIALSFCFGIGAIWGLVEGIMLLAGAINCDANGTPLKD